MSAHVLSNPSQYYSPQENMVVSDVRDPIPEKCMGSMLWPHPALRTIPRRSAALGSTSPFERTSEFEGLAAAEPAEPPLQPYLQTEWPLPSYANVLDV